MKIVNRKYHYAARLFNYLYPDRPVPSNNLRTVGQKLTITLNIKDVPRSGRSSVITEELQIQFSRHVALQPKPSVRTIVMV